MTTACRSPHDFIAPHLLDIPRSGIRDFFDIVANRSDVISLGIGEPDFNTPWHICEVAIDAIENGGTRYTANLGMPELRRAIADYTASSFGIQYQWDKEILVTVGVSEAMDLAFRAIISPGDEVLYHEPSFVAYAPLIRMTHGVPVPVSTSAEDGFRLRIEQLEAKVTPRTKALLLSFPTNPTGATLARQDATSLADFVKRHDILLITDEVYSELTYDCERVSVAAQPGMKERTIFMNGFSKAWSMTGFRLGFACAPNPLLEAMMKIHQYSMMCASSISQKAGLQALRNGNDDIAEMRDSYRMRRNYIHGALNDMGLKCNLPDGAFYIFPDIRSTGLSSYDFAFNLLEQESVACVPGNAFGACGEGFVRCCYATSLELIKEAMRRMAAFVKRCK